MPRLAGGHQLGGARSGVFPPDRADRGLCWAAQDLTPGPSDFPSELCDLGEARSLSGLRAAVCGMTGRALTVCTPFPG